MTWDGKPEHRNLRGDGEPVPDLSPEASGARFLDNASARRAEAEQLRQRYFSDLASSQREAARRTRSTPGTPARPPADSQMPPDPFSAGLPGAIAQAEMVESLIEGGWPEHRACYYVACLVNVGLAMQRSGMMDRMPQWPENPVDDT